MKKLVAFAAPVLASVGAFAAPIAVDLGDAETSVTNAGTAMIGVAVVMLGIGLVYRFLAKKA